MTTRERFSTRFGHAPVAKEITVREDAPDGLRYALIQIAYEGGLTPHSLRSIVCRVLRVMPDPGNWSAFPNVDHEVRSLLASCQWYHVYDVVEDACAYLAKIQDGLANFQRELNSYFVENGIG